MPVKKSPFLYTGSQTNEISFPLGGIGSGCIGLAGNGRLIDWEIANHPAKGSINGFSHFAIRVEKDGQVLDARILEGDLHPPYSGALQASQSSSFGFGVPREYLTGVPHFREVRFLGEFPIARLEFIHPGFPGKPCLTAFNPFIPLNEQDSSLPAAFFEIEVLNPTDQRLDYTVAATLNNPLPANNVNRYGELNGMRYLHLDSDTLTRGDLDYGTLTLATDSPEVSYQENWFRGAWFDSLGVYWHDFTRPGKLVNRRYPIEQAAAKNCATLASHLTLDPGETGKVNFILAWYYPNRENDWSEPAREKAKAQGISARWQNYYATLFADSEDVALYGLRQWRRLHRETQSFKQALFSSDLPAVVLEAISANLAVLKSPTVLRLQDGAFYGFEGCHVDSGCCEGSCTHVWNYAQALPFLFPRLERSMRELDFEYNQRPDGGMRFRLALPRELAELEIPPNRPCADGQFGNVLKTYRDWKISGDTAWLRKLWPGIKKAIAYAWSPLNPDRWDPDKHGVLTGRQHHTLDMELFGPNSWLTGFYLGALKAGAEMAEALDEPETAHEYKAVFERGRHWVNKNLFNGTYYFQQVKLDDRNLLETFGAADPYWDNEHNEIKYQIGEGCGIDQVLAQWHADLYGLGDIFTPQQVNQALDAIFKNNFVKALGDTFNPCRVFGLNDEAGVVMCTWPNKTREPIIPVPYSQEVMTGFEYAFASHLIQRGKVAEGVRVVEAVRQRYDGERRNPWNEIECGSNYARTLASYALLISYSGFEFNQAAGMIGFNPLPLRLAKTSAEQQPPKTQSLSSFRCFWSLDGAWGTFSASSKGVQIEVLHGTLVLKEIKVPFIKRQKIKNVRINRKDFRYTYQYGSLMLKEPLKINALEILKITLV